MSVYRLSERSGGVIGTIGPIGGSGVFSLQERYALTADNYENVSLYLKMNGANGSTTFYDSSLHRHAVTANGNAQISTAQSKFGGASAAFDGSDSAVPGTSSDFIFLHDKLSDYTLEAWLYKSTGTGRRAIVSSDALSAGVGVQLEHDGNDVDFSIYRGVSGSFTLVSATAVLSDSQWQHVAVTNDSGTLRMFVDGAQVATTSWSLAGSTSSSSTALAIGDNLQGTVNGFQGYIDDLRITKGVARYTANFTPPQREFRP